MHILPWPSYSLRSHEYPVFFYPRPNRGQTQVLRMCLSASRTQKPIPRTQMSARRIGFTPFPAAIPNTLLLPQWPSWCTSRDQASPKRDQAEFRQKCHYYYSIHIWSVIETKLQGKRDQAGLVLIAAITACLSPEFTLTARPTSSGKYRQSQDNQTCMWMPCIAQPVF